MAASFLAARCSDSESDCSDWHRTTASSENPNQFHRHLLKGGGEMGPAKARHVVTKLPERLLAPCLFCSSCYQINSDFHCRFRARNRVQFVLTLTVEGTMQSLDACFHWHSLLIAVPYGMAKQRLAPQASFSAWASGGPSGGLTVPLRQAAQSPSPWQRHILYSSVTKICASGSPCSWFLTWRKRKERHYLPTGKVKAVKVKGFSMQHTAQM